MALAITTEPVPLMTTAEGIVRVGGTRVTLDTVVQAFWEGASAEEIQQQYPVLELSDVYATLGYYLKHKTEVDEYLESRRQLANSVREEAEKRFDPAGVRDRLLARRGQR